MSETTNENPKSVVDAEFDEPAYEPADTAELTPKRRGGATTSIAWLALFLGLAAIAGVGYLFLDNWRADREAGAGDDALQAIRRETDERLEATEDALAKSGDRLDALAARVERNGDALKPLEAAIDESRSQSATLESVTPRVARLERSLADLQGISVDARQTFLLAEAEYYLQIANAQLQLAGNAELAALALEQADDRLAELGDPALTDVRRALADELAALDAMEKPDIAGATLTLGSLAQVAESLPVRGPDAAEESDPAVPEEDPGALSRAWASVREAFSGAFNYTAPDDPERPLLTPGAEPLIRTNLALQLQAARLALLRGEQDLFRQSLDDADSWLAAYFDVSSAPVSSARDTIRDLRAAYQSAEQPDISESLRLLRQYRTQAESGQ